MNTRLAPRLLVVGLLLAVSGCFSYRPVRTAPRAGARVRVVVTSAATIASIAPDSTRASHDGILELSGTVSAASAEVVAIRLGSLRTVTGAAGDVERHIAQVPVALVARIEERQFRAGTTALAGFGLATLATGAFVIVVVIAITQGF